MPDIVHELRGLAIGMAAPSLARDTVTRAADKIEKLEALLRRYRSETPLGHQPHMIAAEVDAALQS